MREMFVCANFTIDEQMLLNIVSNIQQPSDINWKHLLMTDYVYHHEDRDYDGGLSFLDRLKKKLGHRHPNWDIAAFKEWIRTHVENPTSAYALVISDMLRNQEDVEYYGL